MVFYSKLLVYSNLYLNFQETILGLPWWRSG